MKCVYLSVPIVHQFTSPSILVWNIDRTDPNPPTHHILFREVDRSSDHVLYLSDCMLKDIKHPYVMDLMDNGWSFTEYESRCLVKGSYYCRSIFPESVPNYPLEYITTGEEKGISIEVHLLIPEEV